MLNEVLLQINSGKLVARSCESFTAAIHEILEWAAELTLRAHDIVILGSIKAEMWFLFESIEQYSLNHFNHSIW